MLVIGCTAIICVGIGYLVGGIKIKKLEKQLKKEKQKFHDSLIHNLELSKKLLEENEE